MAIDPTLKAAGLPAIVGSSKDFLSQTPKAIEAKIESKKLLIKATLRAADAEQYAIDRERTVASIEALKATLRQQEQRLIDLDAAHTDTDGVISRIESEIAKLEGELAIAKQLEKLAKLHKMQQELSAQQ